MEGARVLQGGPVPKTTPTSSRPLLLLKEFFINLPLTVTIPFARLLPAGMWELRVPQHVPGAIPEP